MFTTICVVLGSLVLLKWLYNLRFNYWKNLGIIERPSYFVTYNTKKHTIMKWDTDNYETFKGQKYGGTWEMLTPTLHLRDLDIIKQIFTKDFEYFVNRRTFPTDNEKDHTKLMLSFRETEDWRDLRRILTPGFSTTKMRRLFVLFDSCAKRYMDYLSEECTKGPVEFRNAMGKYTMACIAESVFGIDCHAFSDEPTEFFKMGKAYMDFSAGRVFKLMFASNYPKIFSFLGLNVFHQEADTYLTKVVENVIRSREGTTTGKFNDFLEIMRENSEQVEHGQKVLTEHEIVAQCMNFFAAGSDSIETVLIWAMYELAKNQEIQKRLREQVDEEMEKDGGELDFDRMVNMEYLDMFVSECLRKYPPTMRAERRCLKEYKMPGTDWVVPKGQFVHIPIYPIHHDAEHWPEPDNFDPERFSKANKLDRHPYAYMPFGYGPRMCIAARYSVIETKVCICHMLKNFEVFTCNKTEKIPTYFHLSLKPVNGTWLSLRPRTRQPSVAK